MVTRLTDYTKQFWILLSTDDMDTLGSHNGDEAIVIDQDKRYVFDVENQTWRRIPMSGSGGGGGGYTYHFYTYTLASGASINDVLNAANIPLLAQDEVLIWNIKGANQQSSGSVGFKFGLVVVQDGNVVSDSGGTKKMASVAAPDSSKPSSNWVNDGYLKTENGHYVCSQTTAFGFAGGGNTFEFVQIAYDMGWNVEA